MPNTYTQIYFQIVFTVRDRDCMIREKNREMLQKYITGIIQKRGHKLLSIYCMPDHVHIFVGYNPSGLLPDLIRDVKTGSTIFINQERWFKTKFYWQEGYGAFSYSRSHISAVCKYIENQPIHHKKKTFRDEYLEFLRKFDVDFDERYLFEFFN
ncbi:MAG TPA: IS200/IS605 family transposase [Bacteroidales bacterium]|nr:IS200/IS605 family transposase [Bacteroidales bacterium]HOX79122.1 IS200/IS605 family transposase [Bacteroidales bacterium]